MATSKEKPATPPLISLGAYEAFMDQLREHGVPSRIDKTLMPKSSGSQIAAMMAALRYLGHIDTAGKPSDHFRKLAMAPTEDRKVMYAEMIKDRYSFLFNDPNFNIEHASSGEVAEKFRSLDIQGSTVTKSIVFFLALAKAAGVKVSAHVKPPPAPKSNGNTKKIKKTGGEVQALVNEDEHDDRVPEGTQRFEIPIPNKASVRVIVPSDLDAEDWEMLQNMMAYYIKRWKNFAQ